jgi:hypothetical protein
VQEGLAGGSARQDSRGAGTGSGVRTVAKQEDQTDAGRMLREHEVLSEALCHFGD